MRVVLRSRIFLQASRALLVHRPPSAPWLKRRLGLVRPSSVPSSRSCIYLRRFSVRSARIQRRPQCLVTSGMSRHVGHVTSRRACHASSDTSSSSSRQRGGRRPILSITGAVARHSAKIVKKTANISNSYECKLSRRFSSSGSCIAAAPRCGAMLMWRTLRKSELARLWLGGLARL